jgi:hypothetical protein
MSAELPDSVGSTTDLFWAISEVGVGVNWVSVSKGVEFESAEELGTVGAAMGFVVDVGDVVG